MKMLKRFSASTAIFLLVLVPLCYGIGVRLSDKQLDPLDGLDGSLRAAVSKVSNFLRSDANPDVLVLGSSLLLCPAVRCDDQLAGRPVCYDDWYYREFIPEYTGCLYLQKLLSERTGLSLKFANLGVASSMISDHCSIFENALAHGKRPRLIICGVAPRDFLDNSQHHFQLTPTRQLLDQFHTGVALMPRKLTEPEVQSWLSGQIAYAKKFFAYLRHGLTDLACSTTGHPLVAHYQDSSTGAAAARPNKLKDLETYRNLYNPPDLALFKQQRFFLGNMLVQARSAGIPVVLIKMPLTRENTAALDKQAFALYHSTVSALARRYGARLLDAAGSQAYVLSDFEDSCHLNAAGGKKLYADLVNLLACDQSLMRALAPDRSGQEEPADLKRSATDVSGSQASPMVAAGKMRPL